jgi:hypothetical protein
MRGRMPVSTLNELIPVLQVAIGPVVLISGVGLLLLTMTNRYGRVIDRARILAAEMRETTSDDQGRVRGQLAILSRRAELIRTAIVLASLNVLLDALLIIVLFLTALFRLEVAWLISALFIAAMLALIASLIVFMVDLNQSLAAVRVDLGESRAPAPDGDGAL